MQQPHEPFFSFSVPPKPHSNNSLPLSNSSQLLSPILTNLDHQSINQIPFNPLIDHPNLNNLRPHSAGTFAFNVTPSSSTSIDSSFLRSPINDSSLLDFPSQPQHRPLTSLPSSNHSNSFQNRSQNLNHLSKPISRTSFSPLIPNLLSAPQHISNYAHHARPMTAPDAGWPGASLNDSYHYASPSASFAHQLGPDSLPKVPEADAPGSSRGPLSSPDRSPRLLTDHLALHSSSRPHHDPSRADVHSPTPRELSGDPSSEGTAGSPDSSQPSPYTPAQPDLLRPNTHAGTSVAFAANSRLPLVQPRPNTGHPNRLAPSSQHTYAPSPMLVHQYRQPIFSGHSHHHHQFFGPSAGHYGVPPSIGGPPHQERLYNFNILPGAPRKRARRRFDEVERLYECNYPGCTKAYGTLNHLNAHITMQKHGPKRLPQEFKEIRKEWRARKKAEAEARAGSMHSHQPMGGYAIVASGGLTESGRPMTGGTSTGSSPANSVVLRPAVGPFSAPPNAQAFAIAGQTPGREHGDWYSGGEQHGTGQNRFASVGGGGAVEGGLHRPEFVGGERFHEVNHNGMGARNSGDGRAVDGQYYEHHCHQNPPHHHHQPQHEHLESHQLDFAHHHHYQHHHQQELGHVDEQGDCGGGHGDHHHHPHHPHPHHQHHHPLHHQQLERHHQGV